MSMLYVLGKAFNLPGAYLKTFWEHLVCRVLGLPIETEDYLTFDERLGHVEHEFPETLPKAFLLCWLPGLFNRIIGVPMFIAGAVNILYLGVRPLDVQTGERVGVFYFYLILLYLGIAFLTNVFPLVEDAMLLWEKLYGKESNAKMIWKILLFIPASVMYGGAYAEQYSGTVILAVLVTVLGFLF